MTTPLMTAGTSGALQVAESPSFFDRVARDIVLARLEKLDSGQIILSEDSKHMSFGRLDDDFPLPVQVCVLSPRFYSEIAFGGAIGAGEAFVSGYWSCSELTELTRILVRNRGVLEQLDAGLARLGPSQ